MKISTEISSSARIVGEENAIECIAKAGFDAWDFSMFCMFDYDWGKNQAILQEHPLTSKHYLEFARHLRQIGLDNGIVCNQSHAPFPICSREIRSYMKRAIECTAEAGGKICVIHPDGLESPEVNAEIFRELLPFAKECGVKIATENMWTWDRVKNQAAPAACATAENFQAHLDAVNDEYLVACLDIGHAEMRGVEASAVELIRALGSRLQALHIHDNDKWHDSHQIPFSMNIDFLPIVDALKEIQYQGEFTLEANAYLAKYGKENLMSGLRDLERSARRLANLFDGRM